MTNVLPVSANQEHKDRLFNFIFGRPENRKWTLSLYNAVNNTGYEDETKIEFNTLDDYLYVSMQNDTSFLFAEYVNLYEHQSTYNPNMPLRMMQYISAIYDKYITSNELNKYGSKIMRLPVPRLVVFYNGSKAEPDEKILRLSDSFPKATRENADIEVRVRMLNINHGHNRDLMNSCRPLYEYAWFVQKIRELKSDSDDLGAAVGKALEATPEEYLLKPFLKEHMAEVTNMLSAELQEISAKEMIARASFREGEEKGEKRGIKKGEKRGEKKGLARLSDLNKWLFSQNRVDDVKKAAEDPEYLEKMFAEYDECQKK